MEFFQLFSFFTIHKESILLLPKIWTLTTPIAAISIIFPSFFFLIFTHFLHAATDEAILASDSFYIYLLMFFVSEIIFVFVYILLAHLSGISTIITTALALAYPSNSKQSPSDLLARLKRTRRRPLKSNSLVSRKAAFATVILGVSFAVLMIYGLINALTVSLLAVLAMGLTVYQLKSSVGWMLAHVASVVEEISDAAVAAERGEALAEGQRLEGFMMNLFSNIVVCVCFVGFVMIVGDRGALNITVYGLSFLVFMGLVKIYLSVVVTVFYFHCKKCHGEKIDIDDDNRVVGEALYTKLPVSDSASDSVLIILILMISRNSSQKNIFLK
ncbi:uncharacterized protein LOC127244301 [Andrographis paniculata]|uniref:uncharacterized protein LOC127244301 n=1 Tax=Andrographis paniculata TaxID=175694 RepID=UPI0021E90EF7|nr:uncharacterized protein LOC127244301 [Andrographis paniculata]XP_051120731.1 uncharacterized protein LOC127244301 [Andrographis paniculata]